MSQTQNTQNTQTQNNEIRFFEQINEKSYELVIKKHDDMIQYRIEKTTRWRGAFDRIEYTIERNSKRLYCMHK